MNKETKDKVQKKKESWEMAKKLFLEQRISMDIALYGLKSSGHTNEEAAQWLSEINLGEM